MRAGFSFSYPPISLLLGQPLSIKKSYAGAIHKVTCKCLQGGYKAYLMIFLNIFIMFWLF
jgi:hypothetical protein